jgi:hypothetical protein
MWEAEMGEIQAGRATRPRVGEDRARELERDFSTSIDLSKSGRHEEALKVNGED